MIEPHTLIINFLFISKTSTKKRPQHI